MLMYFGSVRFGAKPAVRRADKTFLSVRFFPNSVCAPYCGHVFVFCGRRGDMLKVLWWSRDGLCLLAKRLERGRFVWPQANSGSVSLTQAQLSMRLEGIDWRRPERTWRPTSAL